MHNTWLWAASAVTETWPMFAQIGSLRTCRQSSDHALRSASGCGCGASTAASTRDAVHGRQLGPLVRAPPRSGIPAALV